MHPHRFGSHGSHFHHEMFHDDHHHHGGGLSFGTDNSGSGGESVPWSSIDPDVKMGLLIVIVVAVVGLWIYTSVWPEIRRKLRARAYDRQREYERLAREAAERHPQRDTVGR